MKQLGRYQLRVRRLLLLPAIVAFSWWLADQAVETRIAIREQLMQHEMEAWRYQKLADSKIPAFRGMWLGGSNPQRGMIVRPLSAVEIQEERDIRAAAARRAAYHRALTRKYKLAAWLPWLPLAPDPPGP